MLLFVTLLHIILCVILMLVILLQPGKGADVGAAFGGGGGSSTIFGPRGAGSFLSQATTIVAVLFMATSVTLAIYSNAALRTGSDIENEIQRLQKEEQGEMYTVPEDKQQAAPQELPAESLFPAEQPDAEQVEEVEADGAQDASEAVEPQAPEGEAMEEPEQPAAE
jgi:preprotein translocase subunit SecG